MNMQNGGCVTTKMCGFLLRLAKGSCHFCHPRQYRLNVVRILNYMFMGHHFHPHHIVGHHDSPPTCSIWFGQSSTRELRRRRTKKHNLKLALKLAPSKRNSSHICLHVRIVCHYRNRNKENHIQVYTLIMSLQFFSLHVFFMTILHIRLWFLPLCARIHTDRLGWPIMPIGPSLIYLMCSGACACQHGDGMQSWSSHSSRRREDVGNREGRVKVGPSHTYHLFLMDFSISVSVHGGITCLLSLLICLCSACTSHPNNFFFLSPSSPVHNRGLI